MTGVTNKTAGAIAYQGFNETYQALRRIVDKYSELIGSLECESEALQGLQDLEYELTDLREAVMYRSLMFRSEAELKR